MYICTHKNLDSSPEKGFYVMTKNLLNQYAGSLSNLMILLIYKLTKGIYIMMNPD